MLWAIATGISTSWSASTMTDMPWGASTPEMRQRRSLTRSQRPTGGSPRKSSRPIVLPTTQTAASRSMSPAGRNSPLAICQPRISRNAAVVPMIVTSRSREPEDAAASPTMTGARISMAALRSSARASPSVRSRGVAPPSMAAPAPVVSVRPGRTISRLVPSERNSSVT